MENMDELNELRLEKAKKCLQRALGYHGVKKYFDCKLMAEEAIDCYNKVMGDDDDTKTKNPNQRDLFQV